mmetsp:Transcript_4161/g.5976  ORF Transcript_4161/g.5976 Transcript_4161/m.5976 type:complete len:305 (+) Transcript_4161:42-956(+)|eukprot:CAMPEP_0184483766 /NCGR_PEP_ID=MMETSP0113_2-20130426/5436_1 /TAXON_ID=91329 /ORGANISM="Norrisiella sphaerica, Strain BC52" /LENGTH=304 /DNA_ID=CAMNT_0026864361 /DNA_START=28 /DNA_END=942 /DNA_ORIENTATION=-
MDASSIYMRKLLRGAGLSKDSQRFLSSQSSRWSAENGSKAFRDFERRSRLPGIRKSAISDRQLPLKPPPSKKLIASVSAPAKRKRKGNSILTRIQRSSSSKRVAKRKGSGKSRSQKGINRSAVKDAIKSILGVAAADMGDQIEEKLFEMYHTKPVTPASAGAGSGTRKRASSSSQSSGSQYILKARTFVLRLKQSKEKREAIVSGKFTPVEAIECIFALSEERKAELKKFEKQHQNRVRLDNKQDSIPLEGYVCQSCGGQSCFQTTLFQRKDICKGETWGSKSDFSRRVSISCSTCGHKEQKEE